MSDAIADYLEELGALAKRAGVEEEAYRKEAAGRIRELEQRRAFAWRRLNLLRAVKAAVAGAQDAADAGARGGSAMLVQIGWNGATQRHKEVADRFAPVAQAIWAALPNAGDSATVTSAAEIRAALVAFEAWFAQSSGGPFLALMEREIVELPLVEV